jgi:hypothetical protein
VLVLGHGVDPVGEALTEQLELSCIDGLDLHRLRVTGIKFGETVLRHEREGGVVAVAIA